MKVYKTSVVAFSLLAAVGVGRSVASGAPANLQYDEIVRVVIGQATPPPPGAFQADLAAVNNPPNTETAQQPSKKHGFGNILGAVLKGQSPVGAAADDAAENAASNALGGLLGSLSSFSAFMHQGKLARYTFFNGWERVDDVAARTATITKNDRHQSIALDLEKKTYRITDLSSPAAVAPTTASSSTKGPPQQPGTAVVDLTLKGTALGPQTLDGVSTVGYSNTITMAMMQATGSCRNGSFSILSSSYVSTTKDPQTSLSLPAPSRIPTDPRSMVSRGGCSPTFTVHSSGAAPPSGRFSMYSSLAMQPQNASTTNASSFTFITERGNVKTLSAPAAAALFEIPAGFARQQ